MNTQNNPNATSKDERQSEILNMTGYLAACDITVVEHYEIAEGFSEFKLRSKHWKGYMFLPQSQIWGLVQEYSHGDYFRCLPDCMMPKGSKPAGLAGMNRTRRSVWDEIATGHLTNAFAGWVSGDSILVANSIKALKRLAR